MGRIVVSTELLIRIYIRIVVGFGVYQSNMKYEQLIWLKGHFNLNLLSRLSQSCAQDYLQWI